MFTTLAQIRAKSPCETGWRTLLRSLPTDFGEDTRLPLSHILDSNGLEDALWSMRAVSGFELEKRKFALWCAERIAHHREDGRVSECLTVVRRFLQGTATTYELYAARSAARSAARYAVESAARSAAWSAVYAAAGAAEADAYAAARDAEAAAEADVYAAAAAAEADAYAAAGAAAEADAYAAARDAAEAAAWSAAAAAVRAAAAEAAEAAAWSDAHAAARAAQEAKLREILAVTEVV